MIIYLAFWIIFALLAGGTFEELPLIGALFFIASVLCGIQGWSAV